MNKNANQFALTRPGTAPFPAILLGDSHKQLRIGKATRNGTSRAELIAANEKLREDLARQRALSRDLRNVLFSLDVPALFLDRTLKIRLFTPAASVLFGLLLGDVGKPAAEMSPLAVDSDLQEDSRDVLRDGVPVEREIQTACGAYFARRAMPYRSESGSIDGVVVTFIDIGERKRQARDTSEAGDAQPIEITLPADMPDADDSARRLDGLSKRQREILDLVLAGHPSKNIAADLGISRRTVEGHRAAIMKKLGVKCLPALARMAVAAAMRAPN
jgi:DNA-binding CsgD family transcriptional regulator/PAS domain-containing protein